LQENSDILSKKVKKKLRLGLTNADIYYIIAVQEIKKITTCAFNQETKLIQCKSKTVALLGDRVKNRDSMGHKTQ